jgi:FKBP-type peptidyl-prolyl cis-trans isomerase 2
MSRPMNPGRLIASIAALGLVAAACGSVTEGLETTTTGAETTTAADTTETTTAAAPSGDAIDSDRTVAVGDTVSVHYVGTLDSGEEFDSSRVSGQPLTFSVGGGQTIIGFDGAVQGMKIGEIKTVRLAPAEAYGEKDPGALIEVPLEQVPEGTQAGDTLFSPDGQSVTVVEINDGIVIIDANHSLAGEFLTFEIEIVSIDS